MKSFSSFAKYITEKNNPSSAKHNLYALEEQSVRSAEARMDICFPEALREFYLEIGYGFFNRGSHSRFNRLIDPESVADIRLREDIYEYDPDLEIYDDVTQLVFYEVVEGLYFSISLEDHAIYYIDIKIADSLEEFLRTLDQEGDYFNDLLD